MIGDAVLGVCSGSAARRASWYRPGDRLDPRSTRLGAGILWIGGDLVGLPFI
jgi:hypothetical protein